MAKLICVNNKNAIPELKLRREYESVKETDKSYYIETKLGVLPYAKMRFLKII